MKQNNDLSNKKQQQEQQDNSINIAIKVPYHLQKQQHIQKIITPQILQKMEQNQDHVSVGMNDFGQISRKKNSKPLYEIKVVKYRNKKTGQIVEKIQNYEEINIQYDFNKLADFVRFSPAQKQLTSNKIIQMMKESIFSDKRPTNYDFMPLAPAFLKPFNSSILPIDMLQNRIKNEPKNFIKSKQIAYDDQIPLPPFQIFSYIKKSKIFKTVESYFQKRPCWLRNVLVYQLRQDGFKGQFTINELKNILKFFSYTFRDGPWKHVFCRFDFNPKERKQACLFQSVLIKIKQKEVEDYQEDAQILSESDNVYDPTMKEIPSKFMKLYQLVDIEDARIHEMVQTATISSNQCSKQYGWFTKKQFSEIHSILKDIRNKQFS